MNPSFLIGLFDWPYDSVAGLNTPSKIGQQAMDCRIVGFVQSTSLAQAALASAALARQQMAQKGALVLDLSGLAEREALGGAA